MTPVVGFFEVNPLRNLKMNSMRCRRGKSESKPRKEKRAFTGKYYYKIDGLIGQERENVAARRDYLSSRFASTNQMDHAS